MLIPMLGSVLVFVFLISDLVSRIYKLLDIDYLCVTHYKSSKRIKLINSFNCLWQYWVKLVYRNQKSHETHKNFLC